MSSRMQYGIQLGVRRRVPGGGGTYGFLEEDKLRTVARELNDAGLRVSFLNTPMLKFTLPGTETARKRVETEDAKTKRLEREKQQFERRIDDLRKAIRAAHIFGVKGVRVFTFSRVAEPESVMPRIAQVIDEMVAIAQKEGIELLVENEASCNVATCA